MTQSDPKPTRQRSFKRVVNFFPLASVEGFPATVNAVQEPLIATKNSNVVLRKPSSMPEADMVVFGQRATCRCKPDERHLHYQSGHKGA